MKLIRPLSITDAVLTSSNVAETDYTVYSGGTTYAEGDRVRIVSTDVHKVFESLQASNIGHTPVGDSDDTWWILVGSTNRWKMFDQSVTSQTSNSNTIDCVFATTGIVDSVVLLNVDAASARVTQTDALAGVVYDKTVNLVFDSGITDWYAYFFEPVVRVSDVVIDELLPYANATVEVIITDTGNTPLCGGCVLGQSRDIGQTEQSIKTGIQDYSVKQQDTFGNFTVLERAFNKRATFSIFMESFKVDAVQKLLATYRATPIVYIGSNLYGSSIIYGFYKDFNIDISYFDSLSSYTLEVEGLT